MRLFVCHFSFFSTYKPYNLLYSYIGDYMSKRFKTRRKIKIMNIVYIIIFIILFYFFKILILRIKVIESNEKLLNNFLNEINNNSINNFTFSF